MDKAVTVAQDDFATIRTGRAHPAMFTKITPTTTAPRPRCTSSLRSTSASRAW